nr:MAG TPA: hypothetical protein [Caudoviricetes sp.]
MLISFKSSLSHIYIVTDTHCLRVRYLLNNKIPSACLLCMNVSIVLHSNRFTRLSTSRNLFMVVALRATLTLLPCVISLLQPFINA